MFEKAGAQVNVRVYGWNIDMSRQLKRQTRSDRHAPKSRCELATGARSSPILPSLLPRDGSRGLNANEFPFVEKACDPRAAVRRTKGENAFQLGVDRIDKLLRTLIRDGHHL
jgi:hypothetical protein